MVTVSVQNLNHSFGQGELKRQVLFDNHLDVSQGEIVIMTGPSGSGKTTLLTLIGALRTVQDGSLVVLGQQLSGLPKSRLVHVRREIGFIFQAHNLFQSLSATQNVRMALQLKPNLRSTEVSRAHELLETLGLGHRLGYKPQALSGGQKQRVAIARALATRPRLILADEPTAALDKQSSRDVVDLLQRYAREEGCTILMVTHDSRILDVADRIVNMVDGRVISNVLVQQTAEICEFLLKCPLFKEFTPSTLSHVADNIKLERYPAGAVVIRQGDPGDKFYLIRQGVAKVSTRDEQGERVVAKLNSGDFFGEAALLTGEPRNATIRAVEPLELYALGKEDFQHVLGTSRTFEEEIRRALFDRQ